MALLLRSFKSNRNNNAPVKYAIKINNKLIHVVGIAQKVSIYTK
jgi:hypothetical protein